MWVSSGTVNERVEKGSIYWKNTADNLSSIQIKNNASQTSDAHIMLYRTPKASGQSSWELMEVQTVTTQNINTTPIDFTGLLGDSDLEYKLTLEGSFASGSGDTGIQINSDTGTNYTKQRLFNSGGSIGSQNLNEAFGGLLRNIAVNGQVSASAIIKAETGVERMIIASSSPVAGSDDQNEITTWWSNTVDEVTSVRIKTNSGTPSFTGTAKLYRKRNPAGTGDTLPFEVIETVDISGDFSAGHTFSDLLGDSVNLCKLEGFFLLQPQDLNFEINGDTSLFTQQYLQSNSSSTNAASTTGRQLLYGGASYPNSFEMYIYPKSGDSRPMLSRQTFRQSRIINSAFWWNNSVDEITDIKITTTGATTVTGKLILSRLV